MKVAIKLKIIINSIMIISKHLMQDKLVNKFKNICAEIGDYFF